MAAGTIRGEENPPSEPMPYETFRKLFPGKPEAVTRQLYNTAIGNPSTSTPLIYDPTAPLPPVRQAPAKPSAVQPAVETSFLFRDFAIFPNPARNGQNPTIRAQVGLADGVEVRIYDLSNRLVHSAALTEPKILDSGNGKGLQYTYDYIWDIEDAASGVYICALTAKKAGYRDIKKTEKVMVIR